MTSVHPSSIVNSNARIGNDVSIGPFCTVGPDVQIGDGSRLVSHVVLDGRLTIGENCTIFPFACIGTQTQDLKFKGAVTYVEIGDNTTLREYVTVNSGTNEGEVTKVGNNCHIMAYCHIAHACRVGNGVIMANCATLAGEVELEDRCIIGGLSAVHQFTRIGQLCMIGGCSRITQDCPPFMIAAGNPAEVAGINSIGLERRGVTSEVRSTLKEAYRILYRSGLSTRNALDRIKTEITACEEVNHLVSFVENSKRGIIK